jgi:hypothetical protein
MLLIFLSTLESCESSAFIASSPCIRGPGVTVPSMRPPTAPPAGLPAVPTVAEPTGAPPTADVDPEELAVPAELVPGALDAFGALPWPLGSFPELLRPPTLAGPTTPLTAAVPRPPNRHWERLMRCCPTKHLRQIRHFPRRRHLRRRSARNRERGTAGPRRVAICKTTNGTSGKTPFDLNAVENGAFQRVGTILRRWA